MNEKMERMLEQLVKEFNELSEWVVWGYEQKERGRCDEGLFQRTIGMKLCVEGFMKDLADLMGIKLKYGWDFEVYGRGEKWEQEFKYRTVEIVKEGKQRE